uniref:Dynein light chain n=1 Tax=Rhabditophanes sp. KR3021 TaxID=114890 RepID=A0AC35U980_9BILA
MCPPGWAVQRNKEQGAVNCEIGTKKCISPYNCVASHCGQKFCCGNERNLKDIETDNGAENFTTDGQSSNDGKADEFVVVSTHTRKIEVEASLGMTKEMMDVAKKVVMAAFTDFIPGTGVETDIISEAMRATFGGYWMVGDFDYYSDVAFTISRRSRHYAVFVIGERRILVAQEGNGVKKEEHEDSPSD